MKTIIRDTTLDSIYVKNAESARWWLDEKVENSFEYFDLNGFYNQDYFNHDHVEDVIANNYVLYVSHYYKTISGKDLKSVLEIGSAGGWFTKKFMDYGFDIFGVEGSQCGYDSCLKKGIPESQILKHDIRNPLKLNKKYDIVCCTEVAEHIEIPFSGTLIKTLVDNSDMVWFSSVPPGLLGLPHPTYDHCNEQPDKFWINLFDFFNYGYLKLSDEVYNNTQLRGRYVFYNRDVYNITENLSYDNIKSQTTEFETYKKKQIESESFESTFDKYRGGQIFSLDSFLTPLVTKNSCILDAGCGDGTGLKFLHDKGYENLYGIDINPNKYNLAKKYIGDDRVIDSDITKTPFEDKKFDVIWCSHVLEHSYDPIKSLKELGRICKKDGYILLVLPYPTPHSEVHCGVNDLRLYYMDEAESCINVIRESGFFVEEYYTMTIREPELFIKIKI